MPESALSAELAKRNAFFRGQLLDCQKKLESMQASIKSLSDSVSVALNMEVSDQICIRLRLLLGGVQYEYELR